MILLLHKRIDRFEVALLVEIVLSPSVLDKHIANWIGSHAVMVDGSLHVEHLER